MPIDPAVLRARAAEAAALWPDPPACAAAIRRILDDYADRAHRYSPRLAESAPPRQFKTPAPVGRSVVSALRGAAQAAPAQALLLAEALWAGGTLEERQLAAELVGLAVSQTPVEALARMESWLPQIESGETAEALVQYGLGPLLARDPYAALDRARRWMAEPDRWPRRTALAAITALAAERGWDDVPAALDLLRRVMGEREAGVRQAVIAALQALARRDPAGVAGFLREFAGRPDHNTHLIVRGALRDLPAEDQADLGRRLRAA